MRNASIMIEASKNMSSYSTLFLYIIDLFAPDPHHRKACVHLNAQGGVTWWLIRACNSGPTVCIR